MTGIIILAILSAFPAIAGQISNITNSGDGAIAMSDRETVCDTTRDGAVVYFSLDTAFNFGYIRETDHRNYPSPFGDGIGIYHIKFQLQKPQYVSHSVYNLAGDRLFDAFTWLEGGWHTFIFSGQDSSGKNLQRGFYLYKIAADDTIIVKKFYFW